MSRGKKFVRVLVLLILAYPVLDGITTPILMYLSWDSHHAFYIRCARLPNGIEISPEAYYNFWYGNRRPTTVIKGPDGTQLSDGVFHVIHFSATTTYWTDFLAYPDTTEERVYRPDVGLVVESENPVLYKRLVAEAGPLVARKTPHTDRDTTWLLSELEQHPSYRLPDCGDIPLFVYRNSRFVPVVEKFRNNWGHSY